jgi:hypothetical protein
MLASAQPILFPPEILDEIIDLLDETSTLLSFCLVSRRALFKIRSRLFSALEFSDDKSFGRFLYLAGAPWTSFTFAVKEIHLQDMFSCQYIYGYNRDPTQVASNLRNVKSLSMLSHKMWKIGWKGVVPPFVLDVIFQLNIHDLQLEGMGWKMEDMVMVFSRLLPSVKTLAFRELRYFEMADLSQNLSIFDRPFRFRMFDNISLALLKDALDPLVNPALDVVVQAFHIRPPVITAGEEFNPLTWRFLHHIGPCVEQLFITFDKPHSLASLRKHTFFYVECILYL